MYYESLPAALMNSCKQTTYHAHTHTHTHTHTMIAHIPTTTNISYLLRCINCIRYKH